MTVHNVPFTSRLDDSAENLEKKLEQLSYRIRVAMPGIIRSFDADNQLVSVQIAIREKLSFNGGPFENIEIPILEKVPIYMPRAGNFVITMPVTIGDECLVVFGDNCYDAWWESGNVSNQIDNRRHDLSDAIAFIGPWSNPRKISNYSTDSVRVRNLLNDSYVEVKDTIINIVTTAEVHVQAPTVKVDASVTMEVTTPVFKVTAPAIQLIGNIANTGSQNSTVSLSQGVGANKTTFETHKHYDDPGHTSTNDTPVIGS